MSPSCPPRGRLCCIRGNNRRPGRAFEHAFVVPWEAPYYPGGTKIFDAISGVKMNKIQKSGLLFGLTLASAGSAFAQAFPSTYSCAEIAQFGYFESQPECNVAATTQLITSAPIRQMQAISDAISLQNNFTLGGGPLQVAQGLKGMAAGSNNPKWNAWASGNYNDNDFSRGGNNNLNFSGNQHALTVGGDYRLSPMSTVGVSVSYDDGHIKPQNGGGLKMTNTGVNVAPYFAYQLSKNYSVDAAAGLGWGTLKNSGVANLYDVDTERRFAGVNLNSGHWYGNFQVAGKASLFYSQQKNDAAGNGLLASSTKYLAQGRLGVQTGYWMGNGFMPYVGVTYVNDMARNQTFGVSLDKDGFVAGLGLNYFSKSGITGGISYTSEFGRNDVTNNVFMANMNVRF